MKTLYLECTMGAAGDMLTAALLALRGDPAGFLAEINAAGIPGVCVTAAPSVKHGIKGTHISVEIDGRTEGEHGHDHSHSDYPHIERLIGGLRVSETVKKDALGIYQLIADAESHAHGVPVTQIHFHEVGAMDAVADIVAVCMLMEALAPDRVLASPVNMGSGQVKCAHGILPVPAPATAHLLRGIPAYSDEIKGELCTPTGAALLKYFAQGFQAMPMMATTDIGYGMGTKDFERANCVRAFWGETGDDREEVAEIACNLDDMTAEAVAYAQGLLMEAGALDVYTAPIGMKKGRTGVLFTCLCRREDKDRMVGLLFTHTTTLGIREYAPRRHTLRRREDEVATAYGAVRVKTASGYGVTKRKPEYEDAARIAKARGLSLGEVMAEVNRRLR